MTIFLLTLSCKDLGLIVVPPLNLDPRSYKFKVDVLQSPEGASVNIQAIWGTSYNNMYAVGSHAIPYTYMFFHFDGNGWTDITEPLRTPILDYGGGGNFHLGGIHGFAANDFWVVGGWKFFESDSEGIKKQGFVLRYDGSKFVNMTPAGMPSAAEVDSRFYTVWGTSSNDVWVSGAYGFIFHWNGAQWTNHRMTDTTADINGILGRIGNKLYTSSAVSNPTLGFALHEFDGASWREIWYTNLGSYFFINPVIINDTIYAAGAYGSIVRFDPAAAGSSRYKEIGVWGVEERSWVMSPYGFRGLLGKSFDDFVIYGGQGAGGQYNGVAGHYNGNDVVPYPSTFIDGIVYQRGFRFADSFFLIGKYEGGPFNTNIIVSAIPQ
ncbi:MAG: hypothetical protein WEF53_03695 [Bacteroidota bacterium]